MCTCVPKKYECWYVIILRKQVMAVLKAVLLDGAKRSTMVCTCLLSTEWTNFWGMNKNKNKHCCTTSSKSKSSISSLSFRYLPCLMINKELVNTHLSTFEHSNLTRNDKNNSTWPHLKTESLTLALIQHHGCFEKQWTCLVFNEALGPRNIKVNGGQFRRCVKLNSGSFL